MTDWPAAASPSLPQGPPHGFTAPAQQRNDANPLTPFTSEQVAALRAKFLETLLQTVVLAVTNTLTSIPAFDQLQSWAEGVNVIVDTTVQALIDGIANALGHTGAEPYSAADIFTFLQEIPGSVISGITTIEQNIIDAIAQAMGHAGTGHTTGNILTYLEAIPSTVITNVLGAADLGADIQAVVDKISNALGHAGTGHTLANLLSYLGAIPGSVISGITTIEQAALDAIANALGHAGTGHTTSDIQTYLGAIPGSVISGITTIEQNALDAIANALGHAGTGHTTSDIQTYLAAIPGSVISGITTIEQNALDAIANALGHAGTGHTTSDIQTYLGSIPATVITNILGSANLGADLQALVTNLTAVFGGVTTTLAGLNTTLGNTFGSTFPKVFPFTFGTSSSNTPGKFATLAQFQQLLDGIIGDGSQGNTVVAAIGAFHNWLAAVKSEISQAILDGIHALNSLTGIAGGLQLFPPGNITNVLGGTNLGQDLQNIIDNAHNAIENALTSGNPGTTLFTDLTNFLTSIYNGFTGAGATAASHTDVNTAITGAAGNTSTNSTNISSAQTTLAPLPYGKVSLLAATINFASYSDAATLGSSFTDISGVSGGYEIGTLGGVALVRAITVGKHGVYYNVSPTTTDNQVITVPASGFVGGNNMSMYGRINSAGTSFVEALIGGGSYQIWMYVSGSATSLTSGSFTPVSGATYAFYCGTALGTRYYDIQMNGVSVMGGAFNDAGAVSSVGSSFRYGGLGLVGLPSPTVTSLSIADNASLLTAPSVPAQAAVNTSQSTSTTSYTDLGTVGPSVTVTVGSSGMAQVNIYSQMTYSSGSGPKAYTSFVMSGASSQAASDAFATEAHFQSSVTDFAAGASFVLTGLTAGSTTFKLQYRVSTGTCNFISRNISVIPL